MGEQQALAGPTEGVAALAVRQLRALRATYPGWVIYRCRVRSSGDVRLLACLRRPLTDQLRSAGVDRFTVADDAYDLAVKLARQANLIHAFRGRTPLP
jgi:hypothetical protein